MLFAQTNPIPGMLDTLECYIKVMAEDTIGKCSILTCLENKKNMENENEKRQRAQLNFQKSMINI